MASSIGSALDLKLRRHTRGRRDEFGVFSQDVPTRVGVQEGALARRLRYYKGHHK